MKNALFLLLIFTTQAFAGLDRASCTDLDIRDKNPGLRDFLSTPRNQGSVGWCFGFSTADLLSVEVGHPVSSFHVSSIYNAETFHNVLFNFFRANFDKSDSEDQEFYESGWLPRAVRLVVKRKKVCSEAGFPFEGQFNDKTDQIVHKLDKLGAFVRSMNPPNKVLFKRLKELLPLRMQPNINFSEIAQSLRTENTNITLEKLVSGECRRANLDVPPVKTNILTYYTHGVDRYHDKLNQALNRGKPVAMRYNVGHYTKDGKDGAHVSVITGRRWKQGKCQYKVRNSWGQGCNYRSGIDCISKEGSYWIDATDLTDHKFTAYYLSKRKTIDLPWDLAE